MNKPSNNLPLQLSSFIGRVRECTEVKRLLAATRLLTLTGAGGCGKTALALHMCRDLALLRLYADGVYWVEFAPLADAALVPQAVVKALGIVEQPNHSLTDSLLDYLREREMLLVLDNCEHLIDPCAQLSTLLLQACPKVHLLATSREALSIEGEATWIVPSLQCPPSDVQAPVSSLQAYDAVRLFVERASAVRSDFQLTRQNAISVVQICRRLDGIPLAIELAAARVKVLSVEQIATRLEDALGLLSDGKRSAPLRHQTLRATMDWSHSQLALPEQVLFRRLAVFAGSFGLDAAEAVCINGVVVVDDVMKLLSRLVDKSLVVKYEQAGEARYRQLEPIRQYARERLDAASELDPFSRRHLEFYVRLAEQAEPKFDGAEQTLWLTRLDGELANIRSAIAWARRHGAVEDGLRLTSALRWFWYWRGYWTEAREYLSDLLARPEAAPVTPQRMRLRARGVITLADSLYSVGAEESAEPMLEEVRSLAQAVGDQAAHAEALLAKANIMYGRHAHSAGRAYFDEVLSRSRAAGDTELTARILTERGWNIWMCGEAANARADLEEALRLHRALGHQIGIARSLSTLGGIIFHQGDYAGARALQEESLALARALGDKSQTASALQRLAGILLVLGEYADGRALCAQALTLFREVGNRRDFTQCMWIGSNLARQLGDEPAAQSLAAEGLRIARELGIGFQAAHNLSALGRLALAQGDYPTARDRFDESLRIRQQIDNRLDIPGALHDLGNLAFCQEELTAAGQYYAQALAVSAEMGDQMIVPDAMRMLGYIALYQQDLTRAAQRFNDGWTLNRKNKFRLGMLRDLPGIAALALVGQDLARAARLLAAADTLLGAMHARLESADAQAYRRSLESVRSQLDSVQLNQSWSEGQTWTFEQASAEAERVTHQVAAAPLTAAGSRDPNALTARELEVLRLIATGLSDAQVAERLVISRRTVSTHLTAIYAKLGVTSRGAATRHAREHKLI